MKFDQFSYIDNEVISEKTRENIKRKSDFVDNMQIVRDPISYGEIPLFSWIDINLTELCNRKCTFCPRADSSKYPNQKLFFSVELSNKIANELRQLDYQGGIVFCGYGEPLMHPELVEIIKSFHGLRTEIVTNGDFLNEKNVCSLFAAGLNFLCISMYDSPDQIERFTSLMSKCNIPEDKYILRDRWHSKDDDYGLKLTNRAGFLHAGPDPKEFIDKPCWYMAYSLTVDWNGDVLNCIQDWDKVVKFGNLWSNDLISIWESDVLMEKRRKLILGDRSSSPCLNCNTSGTMHGFNHVNKWIDYYIGKSN